MKYDEPRVYFALGVEGDAIGLVKVGISRDPKGRAKRAKGWRGKPSGRFSLLGHIAGTYNSERTIQLFFHSLGAGDRRLADGFEFFKLSVVKDSIQEILRLPGAITENPSFDPKDHPWTDVKAVGGIEDLYRAWGKKGGRPRTVEHEEGKKGCRCVECRRGRKRGKGGVETETGGKGEPEAVRHIGERRLVEDPEQW